MKKLMFVYFILLVLFSYSVCSLPDFEIGFTSSLDKVFFEDEIEFDGDLVNHSEIYLAKNEYEAIQFVLFPKVDMKNVELLVSDFTSDTNIISS